MRLRRRRCPRSSRPHPAPAGRWPQVLLWCCEVRDAANPRAGSPPAPDGRCSGSTCRWCRASDAGQPGAPRRAGIRGLRDRGTPLVAFGANTHKMRTLMGQLQPQAPVRPAPDRRTHRWHRRPGHAPDRSRGTACAMRSRRRRPRSPPASTATWTRSRPLRASQGHRAPPPGAARHRRTAGKQSRRPATPSDAHGAARHRWLPKFDNSNIIEKWTSNTRSLPWEHWPTAPALRSSGTWSNWGPKARSPATSATGSACRRRPCPSTSRTWRRRG